MLERQAKRITDEYSATQGGWIEKPSRVSALSLWFYGVPAVALLIGLAHALGHGPYQSVIETLKEESRLEAEITALEDENQALQTDMDSLKPNGFGIEKIAREQLGWSRDGEIIIHLPDKR